MKFALVDAEKANYRVASRCRWLQVSRAGYKARRGRLPSKRSSPTSVLACWCARRTNAARRSYGSPRVHAELAARAIRVSRKRVVRLDPTKTYVTREVVERQAIRDHFVIAMFDRFIGEPPRHGRRPRGGFDNPFADQGVTQEVNRSGR